MVPQDFGMGSDPILLLDSQTNKEKKTWKLQPIPRQATPPRSIPMDSIPATAEVDWHGDVQQIQKEVLDSAGWVSALQTEMARVIVGQRYLVDRLIVGLLTSGHLLLEGVPGLAKTLALKTLAQTLAGASSSASSSRPTCCPPTSSAP